MKKFLSGEEAQGMTEYILIIALIAVVCIASIRIFGEQIRNLIYRSMRKIGNEVEATGEMTTVGN
jgi:Flp pilus assembly pilin Flp